MFAYWSQLSAHISHSFFHVQSMCGVNHSDHNTYTQTKNQFTFPQTLTLTVSRASNLCCFCLSLNLRFPHIWGWLSPGSVIYSESHCTCWRICKELWWGQGIGETFQPRFCNIVNDTQDRISNVVIGSTGEHPVCSHGPVRACQKTMFLGCCWLIACYPATHSDSKFMQFTFKFF